MTGHLVGENIDVRFGSGAASFAAVHAASLEISPGETVGVVGESGSGKSTLARVLVGLQRPLSGEVSLDGEVIGSATKQIQRRDRWKIQMVFQDPYSSLNPRRRVLDIVAEAVKAWKDCSRSAAREDAMDLLAAVGITAEQARQFPRILSGGQRQRVSIARALAPGPQILIADEPTSAVDQSTQAQLLNLLRRLGVERRLAVLMISHDLGVIRYFTDRVYVMKAGEIVESGPTLSVLANPVHAYTRGLMAAVPTGLAGKGASLLRDQTSVTSTPIADTALTKADGA